MIVSWGILQFVNEIHLSEFAGKSLLKLIIIFIDERNKNWKSWDGDTYIYKIKVVFGAGKYAKGDTLIN
jgi:hypothetical protein